MNKELITSTNYDAQIAAIYSQRDNANTGLLAYRDLPIILAKLGTRLKTLDFGCGTGFSSELLRKMGHEVIGVDINHNMLNEAKKLYPKISFLEVSPSKLPFAQEQFDLVLCAFVLLELNSTKLMIDILTELRRITNRNGRLAIITTSEHFPKHNWLSAQHEIERNSSLDCGDNYRVTDSNNGMVFSDFYYTDATYRQVFMESGFMVEEFHQPLGQLSDKVAWALEWELPPYSIYICSPAQ